MNFELPSLPKGVVINSALITAILLGSLIAVIGLWTFLPLFMKAPPKKQASSLAVNFSYLRTVAPGMDWNINGTATNPSNKTLANIKIRVFSDGNVEGYELVIPSLAAGEKKPFVLYPKIKPSAAFGNFTVQTVVSVPDEFPSEYELGIHITDNLQPEAASITATGIAALYEKKKQEGLGYTLTETNGDITNILLKGNKFKISTGDDGTTMVMLFNGTSGYVIMNGTAYSSNPSEEGGDSSSYLEIQKGAKVVGTENWPGKEVVVIEREWNETNLMGHTDHMRSKLWYWIGKGVPLKVEIYQNGDKWKEGTIGNFVFGNIADSEFELPPGTPVKPIFQFG